MVRRQTVTLVLTSICCFPLAAAVARAAAPPAPVPRDTQPWWSPQGTTIAFQRFSAAAGTSDVLFTGAVRGAEADIIGAGRARGFRPASGELLVENGAATSVRDASDRQIGVVPGIDASWSPDGSQIAFFQGDALAVSSASGADVRVLASGIAPPPEDVTGPVWSPDGTAIAAATGSTVEVYPVDGSTPFAAFEGEGENVDPSWSSDSQTLAFARNVSGRWAIWVVGRDGSGAREAIGGPANNRFPQWSPVDGRLAFISDRAGAYGLYAGTPDGAAQELVRNIAPDSPPRWSPNGAQLAVASTGECRRFGITVVSASSPAGALRRSNQCRIEGTAGGDTIFGTAFFDIIDGEGGNDAIFAGNGDDIVTGGPGNDRIGGGPGNDHIDGGPGDDVLSGGPGNDVIVAGPGRDKIGCGPGNDTAYIGAGDTVRDCEHVHRSR